MKNVWMTTAAIALLAVAANAQYKPATPAAPQSQPGAVQFTPNNAIQVSTSTASPDDELSKARRIPREEAIKMVKQNKAVWVDVRSKDAYDAEHIPGAINMPLSDLNMHLTELPPHRFLITYCA